MKIDWKPGKITSAKIDKVIQLREQGMPFDEIAEKLKNHRTYIYALMKWHKENQKKGGEKT